jgi:hypothetical protein
LLFPIALIAMFFHGVADYLDAQTVLVRAVFVEKISAQYLTLETQSSPPPAREISRGTFIAESSNVIKGVELTSHSQGR